MRAERAFERALALNPDLTMAHHLYSHLEVELGRASEAMVRLLTRARARRHDADLLAGARHNVPLLRAARRVGGGLRTCAAITIRAVRTSVAYTFYLQGEHARAIDTDVDLHGFASILAASGSVIARVRSPPCAISSVPRRTRRARHPRVQLSGGDGAGPRCARTPTRQLRASSFRDPEGVCILGMHLCEAGELDVALTALGVAVRGGFHCPSSMRADPLWSAATGSPEFARCSHSRRAPRARTRGIRGRRRSSDPRAAHLTPAESRPLDHHLRSHRPMRVTP